MIHNGELVAICMLIYLVDAWWFHNTLLSDVAWKKTRNTGIVQ